MSTPHETQKKFRDAAIKSAADTANALSLASEFATKFITILRVIERLSPGDTDVRGLAQIGGHLALDYMNQFDTEHECALEKLASLKGGAV